VRADRVRSADNAHHEWQRGNAQPASQAPGASWRSIAFGERKKGHRPARGRQTIRANAHVSTSPARIALCRNPCLSSRPFALRNP